MLFFFPLHFNSVIQSSLSRGCGIFAMPGRLTSILILRVYFGLHIHFFFYISIEIFLKCQLMVSYIKEDGNLSSPDKEIEETQARLAALNKETYLASDLLP